MDHERAVEFLRIEEIPIVDRFHVLTGYDVRRIQAPSRGWVDEWFNLAEQQGISQTKEGQQELAQLFSKAVNDEVMMYRYIGAFIRLSNSENMVTIKQQVSFTHPMVVTGQVRSMRPTLC